MMQEEDIQNYSVGYKNPPIKGRFKKGISGNPRGRRKGSKNTPRTAADDGIRSIIMDEAYRELSIREGDKTVSIPVVKAVIRSMAVNAAKGNTRAQKLFSELLSRTEANLREEKQQLFEAALEYKQYWEEAFEYHEEQGLPAPTPIPHPDHVIADPREGTVKIIGPMTGEEKKKWALFAEKKSEYQNEILECQKILEDEPDGKYRDLILADITRAKRVLEIIRQVIPD